MWIKKYKGAPTLKKWEFRQTQKKKVVFKVKGGQLYRTTANLQFVYKSDGLMRKQLKKERARDLSLLR